MHCPNACDPFTHECPLPSFSITTYLAFVMIRNICMHGRKLLFKEKLSTVAKDRYFTKLKVNDSVKDSYAN